MADEDEDEEEEGGTGGDGFEGMMLALKTVKFDLNCGSLSYIDECLPGGLEPGIFEYMHLTKNNPLVFVSLDKRMDWPLTG